MMSVFGIVTLVHPAVFLITLANSLISLGLFWLFFGRKLQKQCMQISLPIIVFILGFIINAMVFNKAYGLPPISFEIIRSL